MSSQVDNLAKVLWGYHLMKMTPTPSDLIIGLGSKDVRVAIRAVELFKQKLAPKILFSGGLGKMTALLSNPKPEAELFATTAIKEGVPKRTIIIESNSSNTGENIRFSFNKLKELDLTPNKMILVTKPYMERRVFATFMKQWPKPGVEISITSPQLTYEEYCSGDITKDEIINLMVGDLQRIKEYPAKGYQIEQAIPNHVWQAYEKLVELGFTKQLLR